MRISSGLAWAPRARPRVARAIQGEAAARKPLTPTVPRPGADSGDFANQGRKSQRRDADGDQDDPKHGAQGGDAGGGVAFARGLVKNREKSGRRSLEADLADERVEKRGQRQKQRARAGGDQESENHHEDAAQQLCDQGSSTESQ